MQTRPIQPSKLWGEDGDLAAVNDAYNSLGFTQPQYPSRKQLNAVLNRLDKSVRLLFELLPDGAVVNTSNTITINDIHTETQSNNQNITLFDCTLTANAPSKLVKYTIKVAHDNVTVSVTGGGNISYVSSRTFNKGDWVILINNNIEWFVGS